MGIFSFETVVNEHLKEGWLLQGGVAVRHETNSNDIYFQAMILPHDHENSKESGNGFKFDNKEESVILTGA